MNIPVQFADSRHIGFRYLLQRPLTWLLIALLIGYASDGFIGLYSTATTGLLTSTYGNLASGHSDTKSNTLMMMFLTVSLTPLVILHMNGVLRVASRNLTPIILAAWVIVSIAWSQFPFVTLEWAPTVLLSILFVFYISATYTPETQMRLVIAFGTICLLLTIMLSTLPNYRDPVGGWRGIYAQKNMCCMNTEFLMVPAFYAGSLSKGTPYRVFRISYILLSVVVIVFSKSSTGLVVLPLLLGVAASAQIIRRFKTRDRAILIFFACILAVCVAVVGASSYTTIARAFGKDPTLTGRTEIWSALAISIAKHPLLGYGYRAFWRGYEGESAGVSLAAHWAIPSAHNAALEILVTLGAVGLMIVAWFCLKAIRDSFTCLVYSDSSYSRWYATVIVLMFLNSVDEAEMLVPFGLAWLLFMLAAVNLSTSAQKLRRSAG